MKKRDYSQIPLVDKKGEKARFEMDVDGHIAFMEYMVSKQDIVYLTHTEVPSELGGQGVGSALVGKVLDFVKKENKQMAPLCPFVAAYLKRHPEAGEGILAPGYNIK